MESNNTATFIGHRECFGLSDSCIKNEIERLIQMGVINFLNGGMGEFDWRCARLVYELKYKYPEIKNFLVIPYLNFYIKEIKYFDSVIYPDGFEKYYFKAAIPERNNYLIENSCYAICYITHSWGGAAKTYKKAIKNGLTIINFGDNDVFRNN